MFLKKYIPDLLLLSIAIVWGASYSITKGALDYTSVLLFLVIRFGVTFLLLLPFTIKQLKKISRQALMFALVLGIILSGIFLFETYGVKYTSATNAALLISLSIIFTPFIDFFRTNKHPSKRVILSAVLSVVGVYILTINHNVSLNKGDILILLAALLRAIMLTVTKIFTNKFKLNSLALTQIQMGVILVVCTILLIGSDITLLAPKEFSFWWRLLFIVLLCTIFAFFAQNYGVKHSTPNKASLLMGTEPMFGALFAIFLLSEPITLNVVIGSVLIIVSIFIGIFNKK